MSYVRAAYLQEIKPHLYKGEYPVPPEFALRQTKHGPIEVRKLLEIPVQWRGRDGKVKTGKWRVKPGMVLVVRNRKPTSWELAEHRKRAAERELEPPRIITRDGRKLATIVEREQDLFSATRKYLRHITRSLVGKLGRESLPREPGRHQQAEKWINLLHEALEELTGTLRPDSPKAERSSQLLLQVTTVLGKSRKDSLQQARKRIESATGDEQIVAIARSIGLLGLYRREKLLQMRGIAEIGLSIIQVINQIDRGVRPVYYDSIPTLLKKLEPYAIEGKQPEAKELLQIARQTENIYHRIQRVLAFDPYYSRAQSPQVKRLVRATEYAKNNDAAGLYTALIRAHAKIEVLVLGELTPKEVRRARYWLEHHR